jgi:hypothetical protein
LAFLRKITKFLTQREAQQAAKWVTYKLLHNIGKDMNSSGKLLGSKSSSI